MSSRLLVGSALLIACGCVTGMLGGGWELFYMNKTAAAPGPMLVFPFSQGYVR